MHVSDNQYTHLETRLGQPLLLGVNNRRHPYQYLTYKYDLTILPVA